MNLYWELNFIRKPNGMINSKKTNLGHLAMVSNLESIETR